MVNETALVTGATGFVGAHVARTLVTHGAAVRALARTTSPRRLLADLPVDWRKGDLRDADSLRAAVQGCTALFHCAADYRLWSPDPGELYEVNVEGTRRVLQAALEAGVHRVIYTSSVGALGLPAGGGSGTEDTPCSLEKMVGHYKRSKFLAENVAREFNGQTYHGKRMDVIIVNPSTPIGPGDIKPTPTGKMVVDFLNGKMPAYLDTGLNLAAVEDVALGHLLAFQRGVPGRRYILGGRNMTLHAILTLLADVTGLPAPRYRIPYSAAYLAAAVSSAASRITGKTPGITLESVRMAHAYMFFDGSRAVEELGLPQTSTRDAMARSAAWFLAHNYINHRKRAAIAASTLRAVDFQSSPPLK